MNKKEDDFKYYDKRIQEFDELLCQAKSQTLIELITNAKTHTDKSLEKLVQIQKETINYLTKFKIKTDNRLRKFEEHLDLCNDKINELRTEIIPNDLRQTLNDFYIKHLENIQERLKLETDINDTTLKTFIFCADEFNKTLLELIFKPTTNTFHYESIIDILNYIASKFIPGREEILTISKFSVKIRKKQFTETGDKILIYFEKYIDVLEQWEKLGEAYIKTLAD